MPSLLESADVSGFRPVRNSVRDWKEYEAVAVLGRSELTAVEAWPHAFSHLRKDSRYYEIVEDTICPEFKYRYFAIKTKAGDICAIQPFFVLDQDLLAGAGPKAKAFAAAIRRVWPRFLTLRTLMVGCAAGEGHLPAQEPGERLRQAQLLAANISTVARREKASLIVLKEFPAGYRDLLSCFLGRGFSMMPSMPMTRLDIAQYSSFDDYLYKAIKAKRRTEFRRKFKAAEQSGPIELTVTSNADAAIDDMYGLYEQVYERSELKFEKLTKSYFREIGRRMPDKARFFLWRQNGKLIAFSLCMISGGNALRRISGSRLLDRPEAPSLLHCDARHYFLGDRQRLQIHCQHEPRLWPKAPDAARPRTARPLHPACLSAYECGFAAGLAVAGADPRRRNLEKLSQLQRSSGEPNRLTRQGIAAAVIPELDYPHISAISFRAKT